MFRFGAAAAGLLRRVHPDERAAHCGGRAPNRPAGRGAAHGRGAGEPATLPTQIRADLPLQAHTLGEGRRSLAHDAQ